MGSGDRIFSAIRALNQKSGSIFVTILCDRFWATFLVRKNVTRFDGAVTLSCSHFYMPFCAKFGRFMAKRTQNGEN